LVRSEGVVDDDIRVWWNLHPLERIMSHHFDNVNRMAAFISLLREGLDSPEAARRTKQIHAVYGDPSESTDADRPLPIELKPRVTEYIEKHYASPADLRAKITRFSSFNALVRSEFGISPKAPTCEIVSVHMLSKECRATNDDNSPDHAEPKSQSETPTQVVGEESGVSQAIPIPAIAEQQTRVDAMQDSNRTQDSLVTTEVRALQRTVRRLAIAQVVLVVIALCAVCWAVYSGRLVLDILPSKEGASVAEMRTWRDLRGRETIARFVSLHNGVVNLVKKDGEILSVPLERFSDKDKELVSQLVTVSR
jgi:hypothetical protein